MARNTKEEFLRKFNKGRCYSVFMVKDGCMYFVKDMESFDDVPFTQNIADAARFTLNYAKAIMTLVELAYPEFAPYEIVMLEITATII